MKHFVAVTLFDSLSSKKYVTYAPNDAIYIGKKGKPFPLGIGFISSQNLESN
jgi:hypothetical protein